MREWERRQRESKRKMKIREKKRGKRKENQWDEAI